MAVHFKIGKHAVRDCEIVEVWDGDKFIATVVPVDTLGCFRVISSHLVMVAINARYITVPSDDIHAITFFTED